MADRKAPEIVRKLTIKGIIGGKVDIEKVLKKEGKKMDLCSIYGIARRFKADQSDLGSFVRFYGRFRAVNLETGEVTEAPQIIVPGIVQDQLYAAMGNEAEVKEVQFAVRVGVKYDPEAATKYVYYAQTLEEPSESDPLEMLGAKLRDQKALPAPKK